MADERQKARELEDQHKHSERVSEDFSPQQKEERQTERAREKPHADGTKPHGPRARSRSEFDDLIEEKEGRMAQRTPEEMSLHEELSRIKKDEEKRDREQE